MSFEGYQGFTTLRQCVLEWDEDRGFDIHRHRVTISLGVYLDRDPDDVNRWSASEMGGALGIDSTCPERSARDQFVKSYIRLKKRLKEAEANGLFAKSKFTIGSFSSDKSGVL